MEINFLACFRTYLLLFVPLSRNFSIARCETSSHLDVIGSIFASYVRRSAFTHLRLSISISLERLCVGNGKRSEVHYRNLGHDEYITQRIWPGYVADLMAYNLTWCQLLNSWIKEAATNSVNRHVIIISIRDVYVYFRNSF